MLHGEAGVEGLDDAWGGAASDKGGKQARKYIQKSYRLWKQWTQYLVDFSLTPENQREPLLRKASRFPPFFPCTDGCLVSTDDFAGWLANQTNLALKGIIGIRAMSGIAEAVGNDADAEHYRVSL
jgi:hypothetical protein